MGILLKYVEEEVLPRFESCFLTAHPAAKSPVPPHTVQIAGMQVCVLPSQVHPAAETRPPPHPGHRSLLFMIAPSRVADHQVGFTR